MTMVPLTLTLALTLTLTLTCKLDRLDVILICEEKRGKKKNAVGGRYAECSFEKPIGLLGIASAMTVRLTYKN